LELDVVVLSHVEEGLEGPNAGAFLFEELDDHLPFLLVGGAGARWKVRCGGEVDVRLVVEEICDLLVDADKAFTPIEGRDTVGGVG
jgi:hypothetical protein